MLRNKHDNWTGTDQNASRSRQDNLIKNIYTQICRDTNTTTWQKYIKTRSESDMTIPCHIPPHTNRFVVTSVADHVLPRPHASFSPRARFNFLFTSVTTERLDIITSYFCGWNEWFLRFLEKCVILDVIS